MIKFSKELEKQFEENDKRIRIWATWKLKAKNFGLDGTDTSLWERMSKYDQEFNLVWNEIQANLFNVSLAKLKRILKIVKEAK